MKNFTVEETNLMCCFNTSSRKRLIDDMKRHPERHGRRDRRADVQNRPEARIHDGRGV